MDIYIIRIFRKRRIKIRARFFQSTEDIVSYHTLYIQCIYPVILILVFYWSLISRLSLGLLSVGHTIQTTNIQQKTTATRNEQRWGLIEKKNKIALIVFNYSVTRVKL